MEVKSGKEGEKRKEEGAMKKECKICKMRIIFKFREFCNRGRGAKISTLYLKYNCRWNRCTGTSLYSSSAAHTLYNVPNVVVVYYAAIATKRRMESGIYNIQNTMAVTHILQTQEKNYISQLDGRTLQRRTDRPTDYYSQTDKWTDGRCSS